MSEELVTIDRNGEAIERLHPSTVIQQATEEANVLADVIESQKLYSMIQGKKFVKCEGWVTLATLRGCLPREVSVTEMPEGRYVATVELVRMSDGSVLTRASAECGGPEDTVWSKRPPNARRSMAITRATGKSCRVPFSWVMALAGFEPTPAEEMDFVGGQPQTEGERSGPAPRATEATSRQWPARGVPAPDKPKVEGPPVWRGKLIGMRTKAGESKGKAWTLYTFTGDDKQEFGTFSETVATALQKLDGHFVEIVFSTTAKGNQTIEEYKDVSLDEVPL